MYANLHVCKHTCATNSACIYVHICTHECNSVCVHVNMHTHTCQLGMPACKHTCMQTYMHIHVDSVKKTQACMHVCICTHSVFICTHSVSSYTYIFVYKHAHTRTSHTWYKQRSRVWKQIPKNLTKKQLDFIKHSMCTIHK